MKRITLLSCCIVVLSAGGWYLFSRNTAPVAAVPDSRFVILVGNGEVLLTDQDIATYDWSRHAISLKPESSITGKADVGCLVQGIPFVVVVDNVKCYQGTVTTRFSSVGHLGHVIDFSRSQGTAHEVVIEIWGNGQNADGIFDRRSDERIRSVFHELGKLVE